MFQFESINRFLRSQRKAQKRFRWDFSQAYSDDAQIDTSVRLIYFNKVL